MDLEARGDEVGVVEEEGDSTDVNVNVGIVFSFLSRSFSLCSSSSSRPRLCFGMSVMSVV